MKKAMATEARNKDIVSMVLGGKSIKSVAAMYGITPPRARQIVLRDCKRANEGAWTAGILNRGKDPNDPINKTVPLMKYLITHKHLFLKGQNTAAAPTIVSNILSMGKRDAAELSGLPYRTIQFYTDQGLVIPDLQRGRGRGRRILFSYANIIEFVMARYMNRELGLKVSEISSIMGGLRKLTNPSRNQFFGNRKFGNSVDLLCIATDPFKEVEFKLLWWGGSIKLTRFGRGVQACRVISMGRIKTIAIDVVRRRTAHRKRR